MENSRRALLEGSNKMSSLITLYFVEKEKIYRKLVKDIRKLELRHDTLARHIKDNTFPPWLKSMKPYSPQYPMIIPEIERLNAQNRHQELLKTFVQENFNIEVITIEQTLLTIRETKSNFFMQPHTYLEEFLAKYPDLNNDRFKEDIIKDFEISFAFFKESMNNDNEDQKSSAPPSVNTDMDTGDAPTSLQVMYLELEKKFNKLELDFKESKKSENRHYHRRDISDHSSSPTPVKNGYRSGTRPTSKTKRYHDAKKRRSNSRGRSRSPSSTKPSHHRRSYHRKKSPSRKRDSSQERGQERGRSRSLSKRRGKKKSPQARK
jgi:hypothetical protein